MPRAALTVEGREGIVANLYAFNERAGRVIRAVNRRAARQTESLARQLAPEDTGRLKRSLTHALSPDELAFEVFPDPEVFAAEGQPYYPVYVEFGTSVSPAQPFLFPAFEAIRPHYRKDISAALRRAIRERGPARRIA